MGKCVGLLLIFNYKSTFIFLVWAKEELYLMTGKYHERSEEERSGEKLYVN